MTDLQKNVIQWASDRGLNDPVKQTLKTLSEAGELADAICREDEELIKDAIGDVEICLTILKNQLGYDQEECLQLAYDVISKRTGQTVNGTFIKD